MATATAVKQGIGERVLRKEDQRFLTGKGRYCDDIHFSGQAYAAMVRSPHAHARILGIDCEAARKMPGVLAVLTGKEVLEDRLDVIPHMQLSQGDLMKALKKPSYRRNAKGISEHLPLPVDKARFPGEVVAMVVAESMQIARDAAERVEVRYEPLPAVCVTPEAAASKTLVWEDLGSNVYIELHAGDKAAADATFAKAAHVVALQTWVQRVTGVTMEPRAAVGIYDAARGRYELYSASGGAARFLDELGATLGVTTDKVRVVAPDIGGNFGTRNPFYPEYALCPWAAKRVGRPVKWVGDRSEGMLSDCHARDLYVQAELALDAEGRILGMRTTNTSNVGAHPYNFVALQNGITLVTGPYRVPAGYTHGIGVATNTASTSSYRSAGRPEVTFVIERLMDLAAKKVGLDRAEIRRRNQLRPDEMPYKTAFGKTFDSGRHGEAMEMALAMANAKGFPARREEAKRRGRLRGLGIANYIEATGGSPREWTQVTVRPEGRIDVAIGTQSSGQSHETSYSQLVNEWLGIPFDEVRILEGDTDVLNVGGGSQSGRSMRFASIIVHRACQEIEAKGRRIASHALEVADSDLEYSGGRYTVKGTDRSMTLYQAAAAARDRQDLPSDLKGRLGADADQTLTVSSFPYGCHVIEIEVDPDTGAFRIVRYSAVDDVGRAVSPLVLEGQMHGSIVQGVGQALFEHCHYDPETGQMLAGSLMDYCIPRADDLPAFDCTITEVPSTTHPFGVRAGSESGTPPALPGCTGAIVDALSDYGVTHLDMPVTAEKIWRAVHDKAA